MLRAVLEASGGGDEVEITVECNPTSLDEERARALRDQGVNRLSVGVQGLDPERLRFLAPPRRRRRAPLGGGGAAIGDAAGERRPHLWSRHRSGGPSPAAAAAEVERVAATGVTHVSAYSLTIEPGTQFGELARKGRLPIAPDDAVAEAFFAIERVLEARGSRTTRSPTTRGRGRGAAQPRYWRGTDYLGLGCAAYGTIGDAAGHAVRYRNLPDPARYGRAALGGGLAALVESEEPLDPETRLRERIMLGLRLRDGFDLEGSARELGIAPWTPDRRRAADRLIARGDLAVEGGHLRLPRARASTPTGSPRRSLELVQQASRAPRG